MIIVLVIGALIQKPRKKKLTSTSVSDDANVMEGMVGSIYCQERGRHRMTVTTMMKAATTN